MEKTLILLIIIGFVSGCATPPLPAPTPTLIPPTTPPEIPTASPTAPSSESIFTPQERLFDGIPMVLVPAGCFVMGTETGDDDEKPTQEICFSKPFWIDKFEVSNGQFDERVGRAAQPSRWPDAPLPRVNITWFEARLFCTLRGARLPTEAEWEYAASGTQKRLYAWGDTFEPARVTFSANASSKTAPVDSRPDGISWVGALNLSGNVREWVSSEYQTYPYTPDAERESVRNRAIRGGSWLDTSYNQRTSDRFYNFPDASNPYTGFRCASDDVQ